MAKFCRLLTIPCVGSGFERASGKTAEGISDKTLYENLLPNRTGKVYKDGRPILSSLLKVSRSVINHVLSEPNIIENSCLNFYYLFVGGRENDVFL